MYYSCPFSFVNFLNFLLMVVVWFVQFVSYVCCCTKMLAFVFDFNMRFNVFVRLGYKCSVHDIY